MLISVVVPIYKVEKYLNRCIDSILNQSFKDFDLILVDDGSPDNCGKICDEYAKRDSRIHVIHKKNGGLSDARNFGIDWAFENSDSEWITFIDSDDWIHTDYLNMLLRAVNKYGNSVGICEFIRTTDTLVDCELSDNDIKNYSTSEYFIKNVINSTTAWGKLYRKSDFDKLRYPFGKIHEDEYTTYKILFKYDNISVVAANLYYYFTNSQGIMSGEWTPKKIEVLNGFKDQIKYFKKRKLTDVYQFRIKSLLPYISSESKSCKNTSIKLKMIKFLRYLLRKGKKVGCVNRKNNMEYYEIAYPRLSYFYWSFCGIRHKFFKK